MEYLGLGSIIGICIVLPLVVFGICLVKEKEKKLVQVGYFLWGCVIYLLTQWGIKEQGLQWLFNHEKVTGINMNSILSEHYLWYVFGISLTGAMLLYLVSCLVFAIVFKRRYTGKNIFMFGLGFGTAEAIHLAGLKSVWTLIEMARGTEGEIGTSPAELFLSGYERVLFLIIHMSLLFVMAYMIQKKRYIGLPVIIFCESLAGFLPGFFLAFSTTKFLEIYSRNTALIIIYILLTLFALTGLGLMGYFRYSFEKTHCIEKKAKNR